MSTPVKKITIDGQEYPVRYDINALCEYEEMTGKSLLSGSETFEVKMIRALIYVGMKSGHNYVTRRATPFPLTVEDVGMFDMNEVMEKCLEILNASLPKPPEKTEGSESTPGE